MDTQSGNPFNYSNAMSKNNGIIPTSSSRMALDNLLRRELKVSDPNDSQQIAQALLSRYKNTPRAAAISREAEGIPFLLSSAATTPMTQGMTSSDAEIQQAIDDVNRDLQELTTNSILKDIMPELQGWAMAIRTAIQEGMNAARFALDTRQRDKVFGIRRTLGDYARIARLVGALTPILSVNYRNLAQSLDEVGSVLLVMMGEAIANVGFSGGRYLLQVPYTELQVRRDSAIYALRNLVGATQEAYAPNEWPRGLDAYRRLFDLLEKQGQGDLRSLLVENELSRIMDALIHRIAQGTAEGLRAVGATAQLDLERLRRLVIIGQRSVSPESPPLTAFLEALQLFVDGFTTSGGFRLLKIARPTILFYGLYGISGFDDADRRLLNLVIQRGILADQLDCFMQCGCTPDAVKGQIILDKALYDLDRAIDLYALGLLNFGEPERRAAAYGYLAHVIADENPFNNLPATASTLQLLTRIRDLPTFPKGTLIQIRQTLLSPSTDPNANGVSDLLMQQELCIQKDMEAGWENLVKTMAPDCVRYIDIFKVISDVIDETLTLVGGPCPTFKVSLPPHYETSLDSLANDVDRDGNGREG